MLLEWNQLPDQMRTEEVRPYYEILKRKRRSLVIKRAFDVLVASAMTIVLAGPMIIIAAAVKIDSKGPVIYRQERVTTYGRVFKIHKFRTMVDKADTVGPKVTVAGDSRITGIGKILRKYRLDEFPQLLDVLKGDMTFVGTRPEAVKYVERYSPVMMATLLLPAGITSEASIRFKDEAEILKNVEDTDRVYMEEILPIKMKYNLKAIEEFSLENDLLTLIRTVAAVAGIEKNKDNKEEARRSKKLNEHTKAN